MRTPTWLNRTLFGFGLASLFSDAGQEMTALVFPGFMVSLIGAHAAPFALGLLTGFSEAIASISRLVFGILGDRAGHKRSFIVVGYTLTGVFLGFVGFATRLWQVFFYHLTAWAGKGMRESPRDALIAAAVAPSRYGRAFGFHRAMDTIGAILGPLLIFFIIQTVSARTIFFLSWIPGIAAVIVLLIFVRPQDDAPATQKSHNSPHTFNFPAEFWFFLFITIIFACGFYNRMLIIMRVQDLLGGPATLRGVAFSALLYVLFNIVRAAGEYIIGALSDRINKTALLAFLGYGLFGVLSWLLSYDYTSLFPLGAIFVLFGLSVATVKVLTRAYAATLLPAAVRGTGFALVQLVEGFGTLGSSAVVGFLWSTYSVSIGLSYAAFLSMIAACSVWFLTKHRQ